MRQSLKVFHGSCLHRVRRPSKSTTDTSGLCTSFLFSKTLMTYNLY